MNRAYSLFTIKSVDEEQRIIEGIATTPTTDRMGDIVEPEGAQFKLPIPLLWQHNSREPVGEVVAAKATPEGITFQAKFARIPEPGTLKDRIDNAWQSIKYKLVKGMSIGFNPIESAQIKDTWSEHFLKWEWLELSCVTIPANVDASITTIKSADQALLAASGDRQRAVVRLTTTPGVSGSHRNLPKGNPDMKTTAEQIASFEAKRAASTGRMNEIMAKAADEGRTLDETETEEYDALKAEIKSVDEHLVRLKEHEAQIVAGATPLQAAAGTDPRAASAARGGIVSVVCNTQKGLAFTRYAIALANSRGNLMQAQKMSEKWRDSTPEVEIFLKAAVDAGTTTDATWAGPLVYAQNMSSEFIELLRPETVVGRIQGLRKVPFNVRMPRQTAGSTAGWVGEGLPKPVSALAFDTVTFPYSKIAGIVVLTEELVRFSNPSAEARVQQDLIETIAQFTDEQFLDPNKAVSANVSPASVTNGVAPTVSTGTSVAQIAADVSAMLAMYDTGMRQRNPVWVMHPRTARALSLTRTTQDLFAFPGITPTGGTFFGIPVITSTSVGAADVGSPAVSQTQIILIEASEIFLADDGQVALDVSREASVEMDGAPSSPSTTLVSLWQNNMVGLRAERFIHWAKRRADAVAVMSAVTY